MSSYSSIVLTLRSLICFLYKYRLYSIDLWDHNEDDGSYIMGDHNDNDDSNSYKNLQLYFVESLLYISVEKINP